MNSWYTVFKMLPLLARSRYIGMKIKHWVMNDNTCDILSLAHDLSTDIFNSPDRNKRRTANTVPVILFTSYGTYVYRY